MSLRPNVIKVIREVINVIKVSYFFTGICGDLILFKGCFGSILDKSVKSYWINPG